jgi:hypothetical protein
VALCQEEDGAGKPWFGGRPCRSIPILDAQSGIPIRTLGGSIEVDQPLPSGPTLEYQPTSGADGPGNFGSGICSLNFEYEDFVGSSSCWIDRIAAAGETVID